ncbi:prophage tail fiber N-terminal domain-containing protein, partial [Escherichia sp. SS-MK2]
SHAGTITVYEDSRPGTLQHSFLTFSRHWHW